MPPSFALPCDTILADPALALPVAAAKRKVLDPQVPFTYVPDMQEFLGTLVESVNLSLSHSFGIGFWKSEGASTWKAIREEVVVSLESALENPTELAIFQACCDLLLAPSRFLSFLGFVPSALAPKPKRSPSDEAAKLASEAIKRGQNGKALRILTGNGAAPHTNEQLVRTADLFPRPEKFVTYTPTDDMLTLDPLFIGKSFSRLISSVEPESPDVFGWDPTLFRDKEASDRFIPVVTRFLYAFIGWTHSPPICSQLFACSSLISIFKLAEAERELLPPEKKDGIRPIGGQCLFGKMIDRQALESDEAKVYKASVLPVQRAFQSRGVMSIPLAALGALKSGFAVAKGDVSNAYQEICRQAALDNLKKVAPALANFFSRTLLQDIPLFTRDVNGNITVIWSSTGAPQGSVSGNIVFTAGVSEVFSILQVEFPDFFLSAATDDLTQFFKPDDDTHDEWQAQYVRLAQFLLRYESLAWELCSLRQNLSKSALILPMNAPYPSAEVCALFPPGFKFHHVSNVVEDGVSFPDRTDGMVICGAPVGSDFYIQEFVRWKTSAAITKILAIRRLSSSEIIPAPKHVAFKLLASSGIKLMSYVATVVAPQFTVHHLKVFDSVVRNVFLNLLNPDTVVVTPRVERSYHRATLSVGKGGLGLLKASVSAAALWWTNLRSIQADPTVYPFLAGLDVFIPDARNFIMKNVGGPESPAWLGFVPAFLTEVYDEAPEPPPKGLLKELLVAHGNFQNELVKSKFAPKNVVQDGSLTKSDVINFNSRSNLNLVFSSKRIKNLSNDQFAKLTSIFLGLPPPQDRGNAEYVDGYDYPVESCMTAHGKHITPYLDANADHHSGSCPSAALAVSRRHTNLTNVLSKFALEAGADPKREPSSHHLCQGALSTGQCSKLFPKTVPAEYKKKAREIVHLLAQCPVDKAKVAALYESLPVLDPLKSAALRVDLSVRNPSNDKIYLIDNAFLHPSCTGYREAEFKAISARVDSDDADIKKNAVNPMLWQPSVSLAAKAKIKVDKHAPLMQILQHFQREGRVEGDHSFVPFVMSSLGELSREALRFVEDIVSMYKLRINNCEQLAFPLPPNQAVADFRNRFKLALMRVAAVGLANIACSAGKPFGNRSIYAVH